MIANKQLRLHIINVGHGDGILIEFPDLVENGVKKPRFALIDAGSEDRTAVVQEKVRDYISLFLKCRLEQEPSTAADADEYAFEFICLTHPHADHLSALMPVLERFCDDTVPDNHRPREFWDCGFRYNSTGYLTVLDYLYHHPEVQFARVASGTEFHYDKIRITVLAPSVDMRNRYDTHGVDVNNASIILKLTKSKCVAILAGDAHFETWGKVSEEFPRKKHLTYGATDKRSPEHEDLTFVSESNQLNCQFLKVSHHGSKNGTSYEYIDELSPTHFAITCSKDEWYRVHKPSWEGKFPHPITRLIIGEETKKYKVDSDTIPESADLGAKVGLTSVEGTMIYTLKGNAQISRKTLKDADPATMPTEAVLKAALS